MENIEYDYKTIDFLSESENNKVKRMFNYFAIFCYECDEMIPDEYDKQYPDKILHSRNTQRYALCNAIIHFVYKRTTIKQKKEVCMLLLS